MHPLEHLADNVEIKYIDCCNMLDAANRGGILPSRYGGED